MAEHTTEYASALTDPVRYRLVGALADGPRTLESLASELDASSAEILTHATLLERLDVLRATEHGDGTRTYELQREPIIWDTAWGRLPVPTRRSIAAAGTTHMTRMATAAADRGGFDREDVHITRTTVRVDEARWRELSTLLGGMLHTLGDLEEAPAPDGATGPTFQATAVMLLFTDEHAEIEPPRPDRAENRALTRLWELTEELDALGTRPHTDWARVHDVAEELLLTAQSMRTAPATAVEPHA